MVKITTWQADDTCHVALNPSQVHEKKFPNKHRIVISICQLQDQQVPRISTLTFFLLAKHSEDILLANISHGNCLFLVDISYCLTLVTRILKIYSKDANINIYI